MKVVTWSKRFLYVALLLGTIVAVALWIAAFTAKCEGFGCLGVGAIVGMAFAVQIACVIAGGVLIWLKRREGKTPRWLIALEVIHLLPVGWFAGRMMLS
jgi:hypothetical protein